MPPILHVPSEIVHASSGPKARDLNYKYPSGLDLRPGSSLHEKIKSAVLDRARESYDIIKRRHPDWKKTDETLTAYIKPDLKESELKATDPRRPISIVVPYSYATLETLLTYLTSAFLDLPIFKYEAVADEGAIGAIMLEKVIEQQCLRYAIGLNLHTQFRDSLSYGFGVGAPVWTQTFGWRTERQPGGGKIRYQDLRFEGNEIINIDPYLCLPDPNVPIHELQRGEFFGWYERTSYIALLEQESSDSDMFNVKFLKDQDGRSITLNGGSDQSGRETRYGGATSSFGLRIITRPIDRINMYVNLIPSEWGLGNKDYPEKWFFSLAGDQFVIQAKPLGLDHDMFPVVPCAPDYDGYSVTPISRMELIYGLQGVLDFLFNSHVTNIRKAINDMLIVDPFLINMADLENPEPGKLIRMRKAAWGRGVEHAVQQLAVTDITKNHMNDAMMTIDFIQRTSGGVDSLMGIMRSSGERRSATEARDSRMSALSRLAKAAKISSMMTMQNYAYMFASHTQQLMDKDTYVNTSGRHQQMLMEEYYVSEKNIKVTPYDLNIDYDVVPHDGTVEVGEHVEMWTQLFQILSTQPAIGMGFDMVRIFKHIARMGGAKNINEFVRKGGSFDIKTAQDQSVQSEVQKGNLTPIGQGGGMRGMLNANNSGPSEGI